MEIYFVLIGGALLILLINIYRKKHVARFYSESQLKNMSKSERRARAELHLIGNPLGHESFSKMSFAEVQETLDSIYRKKREKAEIEKKAKKEKKRSKRVCMNCGYPEGLKMYPTPCEKSDKRCVLITPE
jgi:rubrerythrin